jgi:hypothetical protein
MSSRNRFHWLGWSMRRLSPSRARASNHSPIARATVSGEPANGVGRGDEMNSTVCLRV